jgi:hypothetical protein
MEDDSNTPFWKREHKESLHEVSNSLTGSQMNLIAPRTNKQLTMHVRP